MSTPMRLRPLRTLLTPIAAAMLSLAAQAQTFGTPLNLSNSAAASGSGQIAVVAADVYAVWVDTPANHQQLARFARSSDGGASFTSPVTVLGSGVGVYGPRVAADGSQVYVARTAQQKNKPSQVYFRASANHGMSFGPEIQLTAPTNGATLEAVAASGGSAHVLWSTPGSTYRLFVSSSGDGGTSFGPAVEVSGAIGLSPGAAMSMRALGSSVHVAWSKEIGGSSEVFYSRSVDGGASFSTPTNLSNSAGQNSVMPQIALAGANVYVAYREAEYRLIRSLDGGASFGAPVDLSSGRVDAHGLAGGPQLAASGMVLHCIWHEDTVAQPVNYDVFHRSSVDGGASFGATMNLSASAPASFGIVAAEGLNAYVVWSEKNGGVLIRQSVDGGASFAVAVNVSAIGGAAFVAAQPAPAGVHVGWQDNTLGNYEILYRFGSTP